MTHAWGRFVVVFLLTSAVGMLAAAAAIALIDPLAISPVRIISSDVLPRTNRRYIVPAIVRSGRYDSYIVGTSTVHTLEPVEVGRELHGRFANVALLGSSPYEQSRLIELIGREVREPGVILWGLDLNWCGLDPASLRAGPEGLPEWLYDADRWNDLANAFNWSALDMARRKLLQATGWRERLRTDGYNYLLPPDASYDLGKARKLIYRKVAPHHIAAENPPAVHLPERAVDTQVPGADMMRRALAALPDGVRAVLVFMPAHASTIPASGTAEAGLLQRCKAAMAAVVADRGDWLIDAMWRSAWTVTDANFWDHLHFRNQLAHELIRGIAAARRGKPEPQSGLRVLVHGR